MDVIISVQKTANPDVVPAAVNEETTFTLEIDAGAYGINDVSVVDKLPAGWGYVSGSTTILLPDGSSISGAPANPGIAGQNLTWNDFSAVDPPDPDPLDMTAHQVLKIIFKAKTTSVPSVGYVVNEATATGTHNSETFSSSDTAAVYISNLTVQKSSNAGGTVDPGDVVQYSLTINNTGGVVLNNVAVDDPLPPGTSYVANSTNVAGLTGVAKTYLDQFSSASYNNSNGTGNWAYAWYESGAEANDGPAAGAIRIANNRLELQGSAAASSVQRTVNLVCMTGVNLSFSYGETGTLEDSDTASVDISADGSSWTNLLSFTNDITAGTYNQPVASALAGENTQIRITATGYTDGDDGVFYVDDIQFTHSLSTNCPPPELVAYHNNLDIPVSGSVSITYQVQVNNPVPAGQSSVVNTVSVSADNHPAPRKATVTDLMTVASIGDQVWLDIDGDGVQDSGEPGLGNVQLKLYMDDGDNVFDAGDTLRATTYTDIQGQYLFGGLPAGVYFVDVSGGVPAELSVSPDGSDPTPAITLGSGQSYWEADFGYRNAQRRHSPDRRPGLER